MKKRIFPALAAAALLTGCSAGNFWKVSKKEIKRSSDEETTAEETTAETSTLPPAEPVVDAHTRHIDITRQKNALYWKRTSHVSEYEMSGFGTIKEMDDSIYLVLSVSEKNLLVDPEIEGGKASIVFQIDDVRFVYAASVNDDIVGLGIYDLASGENFVIENNTDQKNYPYHPLCVSGDYLILYSNDDSAGGNMNYFRFDLDDYKLEEYSSLYLTRDGQSPSAGFSPDGKKAAEISSAIEADGLYNYTATLFSTETGEKIEEFVIGAPKKHPVFSLEFHGNDCIYVYAGNDEGGWDDLYIIDLWLGDGIEWIDNRQEEYPGVTELNIAMPEETDSAYNSQLVYFGNDGCYYNQPWSDADGYTRNALVSDDGSGNPVHVQDGEKIYWSYLSDGILYGTSYSYVSEGFQYICKLENNTVEKIAAVPDNGWRAIFTPDYIYYTLTYTDNKDKIDLYRMDYSGKKRKRVFTLDGTAYCRTIRISGSKIYYYCYDYEAAAEYQNTFGIYDMETDEHIKLKYGIMGRINGRYMYYTTENRDLMRMDLDDYKSERVCKNVRDYDFQGDSIIYTMMNVDAPNSCLYRLDNSGSSKLFSLADIPEFKSGDWIVGVQCHDDEIILRIKDSDGYASIIGTDQQGGLIRKYGEKYKIPNAPKT